MPLKSNESKLRTFQGSTAIITGGASGIGRALAEELAQRGSEVVLADLQYKLAQEVAENIISSGGKALAGKVDVRNFSDVDNLVKETVERTGRLDYMFNNAGIGIGGEAWRWSNEDWKQIIDINFWGVVNGIQAVYPIMLKQGFGHIANTSSLAGLIPFGSLIGYAATKHAVVGLSKGLRAEAAPAGIRVSVICPGVVKTPILNGGKYGKMLREMPPEFEKKIIKKFRPVPPDSFARKTVDQIKKNKAIILVPGWWKIYWWLNRLFPSFGIHLAQKFHEKSLAAVEKEIRERESVQR